MKNSTLLTFIVNFPINFSRYTCFIESLEIYQKNIKIQRISSTHISSHDNSKVTDVSISNCKILFLPNFFGIQFLNLLRFEVLNSNLFSINRDNFFGMSDLTDLMLDFNEIENLSVDTFYDLKSLEFLSMNKNRILRLSDEIFIANSKLKWISFENNLIQKLTTKVFEKNSNLEILNFKKNQLKEICIEFVFLESLNFIDLRGNLCVDEIIEKVKGQEFYEIIEEKIEKCRDSIIGMDIEDD